MGEGESPLGRVAWGGPRAWRAREGLRGAWIEKAQSGLALCGSALGWRYGIRLTPQQRDSADSVEWPPRLHSSIFELTAVIPQQPSSTR